MGDDHERDILAEWAKQVFAIIEQTQGQIESMRKDCSKCKTEVNARLAELDKRLAVVTIKIVVGLAAIAFFAEVLLKIGWR